MKLIIEFFKISEKLPEEGRDVIVVWKYNNYISTKETKFEKGVFKLPKMMGSTEPEFWAYKPDYSSIFK